MRFSILAATTLALGASAAFADEADCRADLAALQTHVYGAANPPQDGMQVPDLANSLKPVLENGSCVLRDISFPWPAPPGLQVRIDSIVWKADWADAKRSFPPAKLEFALNGLRQTYDPNDTEPLGYMIGVQMEQSRYSLALDVEYDRENSRLRLNKVDIDGPAKNGLKLSAIYENVTPDLFASDLQAPEQLSEVALREMDLRIANQGLFEGYVGALIELVHPRFGETPAQAVEAAKALTIAEIDAIPPHQSLDPSSREALKALLGTLPHPAGELHLVFADETGMSASALADAFPNGRPDWQKLIAQLELSSLVVEWTPFSADGN